MKIFHSLGHVVGGTLLIAGTTIGVGMLALPVATGAGGFIPSMAIYLLCWVFMLCTGLLLVEVSLWMPKETSFISMAERLLGPWGKALFWATYLFLFFTVMVAHIAGGGAVLHDLLPSPAPRWLFALGYTALIAPIVYLGAKTVDRINLFLISGVALCYFSFVAISAPSVDLTLLQGGDWGKAWLALPILFTAFTYQVIIPTLMNYMERNVKKIRLSIFLGSAIPLVVYLLWEFVILGIVPKEGLIDAAARGQNAVTPLKEFLQNPLIFQIGQYFAFFALTTSFVPLALSFFDFLADGFKWKKDGVHRLLLSLIVFGLPFLVALFYPKIFLVALGYAGGISCALLFGFMPPFMAWVGRYREHYPKETQQLKGGKPMLLFLMGFALLILFAEIAEQIF